MVFPGLGIITHVTGARSGVGMLHEVAEVRVEAVW